MRLIDADALKVSVPDTSADIFENCRNCKTLMDWEVKELIDQQPTASPWHRVEDGLPEPHKNVLVTGMEAINNSRVYKVMVNDNGTWRPTDYAPSIRWDYWMPIEPPKEDA